MKKSRKNRIWWWLLLVIILAGIGYYVYSEMWPKPEEVLVTKKVFPVKKEVIPKEEPKVVEEEPLAKPTIDENYCTKIQKNIDKFFLYLDQKKYIQNVIPETNTYTLFKGILKRLAARPPIPAGEGKDYKILVQNMYHFFRVLGQKDLGLIREVIKNENDTMENSLEMFYTWVMLGDNCPDPEGLRPSMKVLYRYAGFFLNSTGGRAYLFRRSVGVRLMATYYCILIIHEADKEGENSYGIDILPFIGPLRQEITIYPDFQFQKEYIDKLNQIETYYKKKRQAS